MYMIYVTSLTSPSVTAPQRLNVCSNCISSSVCIYVGVEGSCCYFLILPSEGKFVLHNCSAIYVQYKRTFICFIIGYVGHTYVRNN